MGQLCAREIVQIYKFGGKLFTHLRFSGVEISQTEFRKA